jgi:hypothetical protein
MTKEEKALSVRGLGKIEAFLATTVDESIVPPFVISTEAQRSGEICGFSGPSLETIGNARPLLPKKQQPGPGSLFWWCAILQLGH